MALFSSVTSKLSVDGSLTATGGSVFLGSAAHVKGNFKVSQASAVLPEQPRKVVPPISSGLALDCACRLPLSWVPQTVFCAEPERLWIDKFPSIAALVMVNAEQRAGQPLGAEDLMMPLSSIDLCAVPVFSMRRSAGSKE